MTTIDDLEAYKQKLLSMTPEELHDELLRQRATRRQVTRQNRTVKKTREQLEQVDKKGTEWMEDMSKEELDDLASL